MMLKDFNQNLGLKRRKVFQANEKKRLEEVFKITKHPPASLRKRLASELNITQRSVQIWFQNRRAKTRTRAENKETSVSSSSEDKTRNAAMSSSSKTPLAPLVTSNSFVKPTTRIVAPKPDPATLTSVFPNIGHKSSPLSPTGNGQLSPTSRTPITLPRAAFQNIVSPGTQVSPLIWNDMLRKDTAGVPTFYFPHNTTFTTSVPNTPATSPVQSPPTSPTSSSPSSPLVAAVLEHMNLSDQEFKKKQDTKNKSRNKFLNASLLGFARQVSQLIESKEVDVNKDIDESYNSALHLAARCGHVEVVSLLLQYGSDPNAPNLAGQTALFDAVQQGNEACVRLLIQAGSQINYKDFSCATPLHIAVRQRDLNLTRLLLEKGSDINIADRKGESPLDIPTSPEIAQLLRTYEEFATTASLMSLGMSPVTHASRIGDNQGNLDASINKGSDMMKMGMNLRTICA